MRFNHASRRATQRGVTLLEVLVSIAITVVGLLGVAGLHARIGVAETEAFQREQAVALLQDMVSRITANRRNAMSYVTVTPMGTGQMVITCTPAMTNAQRDLCEWNNALLGAGETLGSSQVGAMIGARGCVEAVSATMPRQFRVSVVWQGTVPTVNPAGSSCGDGAYDDARTRRAVSTMVQIGCLQNDPASKLCVSTF
jgi:type IV pilus assembly protein PilV